MEVLDIGKKVFAVVNEYNEHVLTHVTIKHEEIYGVHVDHEYRVLYDIDSTLVNSCDVFDTRDEALDRAREIINQNILQTIDGSIALAELFPVNTSSMQTVLPDDKAVTQCMIMDKVIRCVNDEETGIFDDWITLHVPDGCSRDEWADLIEGRVQEAYLEACEFFARRMSNLIAKGAWSEQGWTLELFNRDEHYFDDVVTKYKDEDGE